MRYIPFEQFIECRGVFWIHFDYSAYYSFFIVSHMWREREIMIEHRQNSAVYFRQHTGCSYLHVLLHQGLVTTTWMFH